MIEGTEKLYVLVQQVELVAQALNQKDVFTLTKTPGGLWKAYVGESVGGDGDDIEDALMQLRDVLSQQITPEHRRAMAAALQLGNVP
jgi:hypothetical protein